MTLKGSCFCGAVEIEVEGAPEAMGYCHCNSCRSWSASPVNAFSLWKPGSVKVTKGAENVAMFAKTAMSERQFCKICGGHLMANHIDALAPGETRIGLLIPQSSAFAVSLMGTRWSNRIAIPLNYLLKPAELVHIGQLAMLAGSNVEAFVDHVFNFPTMAEAYRVAALQIAVHGEVHGHAPAPEESDVGLAPALVAASAHTASA